MAFGSAGPSGPSLRSCPALIRVFMRAESHHSAEDYAGRGKGLTDEIHIHSWADATLSEVAELIQEHEAATILIGAAAPTKDVRLDFAVVYPDKRGKLVLKECGIVKTRRRSADDDKTLNSVGFQAGDYLDVAVTAA
uniref:Histone deacetylase complex subunit SAP18 n=1 Tax=Haptolina ericina TaxID=156174 RepID=A0A7S3F0A2_9EUKA